MLKNKVGLMTLNSRMYNYGGALQEYALQKSIERLGYDIKIIDYDVTSELNTFSIKRGIKYLSFDKISSKILEKYRDYNNRICIDISALVKERKNRFDEFRKAYLNLTMCYNSSRLSELNNIFDTFICGSDQIWNPDYNLPSFFLNFCNDTSTKAIYAASIGKSKLSLQQKKTYSKYLKTVDYISVREKSAIDIMQPYVDKNICKVLDPTLLLTKLEWEVLIQDVELEYTNYIFCYFLDNTKEKIKAAKVFSEKNNKKIIVIPYLHDVYEACYVNFGDIKLSKTGPKEFLYLIKNADFILTDSFHATIFSLIFNKDFFTFGRNSGNYNMNTRIENLLSIMDASERLIVPKNLNSIDYKQYKLPDYNQKITSDRKKSISFLNSIFEK